MQKPSIEASFNLEKSYNINIFESEEESETCLSKYCHGDLYIIGKLWIQTLRKVLVGAELSIIPVVLAKSKDDKTPEKPPPMKFEDLPIYESPHYEYKDYIADKHKCPKANVKILHTYLYPKVSKYKKSWVDSYTELKKDVGEMRDDAREIICKKKKEIKQFLRSEDNMGPRQGIVFGSTVAGFYIGSGRGLVRKLFFASLGALAGGAACFPKETDEKFREFSYNVGKIALSMFNMTCGRNIIMRERLPCRGDMPPEPSPRPDVCKKK